MREQDFARLTDSELEQRVVSLIVEQLGVLQEEAVLQASFIDDLGADSLDIVELMMSMEETFGVEISDDDAEGIRTIGDTVAYLRGRRGTSS